MATKRWRYAYRRRRADGVRYVRGLCHSCRQRKPIPTTCHAWSDGSRGTCDECRDRGGPPGVLLNGKERARVDAFARERLGKLQFNVAPTREKRMTVLRERQELRADPVATEPTFLHDLRIGHPDYWSI